MSKQRKNIDRTVKIEIVPEDEQPYELPPNWVWVRLGSIVNFIGGGTPSKENNDYWNGEVPWATVKDVKTDYLLSTVDSITNEGLENSSATLALPNELLLVTRMSPGKNIITKIKTAINQDLKIVRPIIEIPPYFLKIYFTLNASLIESMSTGSTVKGIQVEKLKKMAFPLPPLAEQKKIANKAEDLLKKIDETKRLIKEAKRSFELRRAAILDKAFRGELTSDLQMDTPLNASEIVTLAENPKGYYEIPQSWKWTQLKDVAEFKNGYAFKSKDFVEKGVQVIRMGNLYKNNLNLDRSPIYVPIDYDQKILEKYSISNGDILLSLTGTKYKRDYGYAVKVKGIPNKIVLNQRILSLKPYFLEDYIFYYLKSNTFRNKFFEFETGGVNQGNVGSKAVESILIPIPSRNEAKMIETILKSFFDKEEKLFIILSIENNIETLRQSVLAEAFAGRLVTNDLSDESIIDVLNLEIE